MWLRHPSGSSLPLLLHAVVFYEAAGSAVRVDLGCGLDVDSIGVRFTPRPMVAYPLR